MVDDYTNSSAHGNPKLAYENVSGFSPHNLVKKFDNNAYELLPVERPIIGKCLAFYAKEKDF